MMTKNVASENNLALNTFQTNAMAVTTSVFPNLNTFRLGPEFCILFRKLISTCKTHKRATLSERYPDLCQIIELNAKNVCQKNSNEHGSGVRIIFQFYCSPNTISNFLTANLSGLKSMIIFCFLTLFLPIIFFIF